MEMNKWLKELGLTWYDLPGNYIPKTSLKIRLKRRWYKLKVAICYMFSPLEQYAPNYNEKYEYCAYDIRNKIDKRGFCEYEFFSLDYSMALYIYPRLCEFKEKYAKYGTPGCFCVDEDGNDLVDDSGHEKWLEVLDKMIFSFRETIKDTSPDVSDKEAYNKYNEKVKEGFRLFGEYYYCLWW